MLIESSIVIRGEVACDFSTASIKDEPMLFNCNLLSAYRHGGYITRQIISQLPDDWQEVPVIVDSRVHMLKKGWYPCIPGYHHDDVPRSRSDMQPNYHEPEYRSEHLMVLVNASVCPTEFVLGSAEFSDVPVGEIIYKKWHNEVKQYVDDGVLTRFSAPDKTMIQFNDRSWHQGVPAVGDGWRFFIRFSRNTARTTTPTNEIRRQVQVYLDAPMEGW